MGILNHDSSTNYSFESISSSSSRIPVVENSAISRYSSAFPLLALDYPGGKVTLFSEMRFISQSNEKRLPRYRLLDDNGELIESSDFDQRQGRISFHLASAGEEAINIASAAALGADDVVLTQYREPGVLLWRGFTLEEFANQCFGNKADYGKPVGAAYSLKMDKKDTCVGDFHAALDFAAVMEVPVIFICRNNGWAISTHISEQFRSDGIVVKGQAYGIQSIRLDGNDALAVYRTIRAAREIAVSEKRPILVEALTYRVGHHSTSDDSTKYRPADEIEYWKLARNPVNRFRKWVERNDWWSDKEESELTSSIRKQLLQAIQVAEKTEKPPLGDLFSDVYDLPPSNLREQEDQLRETINRLPQDYPSDVPLQTVLASSMEVGFSFLGP
ncbi:hypothetical protein P3X46_021439 [Hevea brasiliensis]|uniref:Dehydrogenase E1 component domain-containing protein n=1 Tax=Hevea brasiliensis TaxID=3981 RepID=A0ABQ9LFK2_HEVBR|nr:hypothetical protein P3X46_021439 [Hevea brasiliensis]